MSPVVVVTVIIVVPMALVVFPTAVVVVVVRMCPIRAGKGRPAPYSGNPHIPSPVPVPIPVDPGVTRARERRPDLVTQGRRSNADIDTNSGKSRHREGRSQNCASYPFSFHTFSPLLHLSYSGNPATS